MTSVYEAIKAKAGSLIEKVRGSVGEAPLMFILAFATGLLTGVIAFLLKRAIGIVSRFLTTSFHESGSDWWFLLIPVAGLFLAGVFQKYVLGRQINHGISRIIKIFRGGDYKLGGYWCFSPFIASTFTLGFGGSAGSEGPIAATGAGIGSNIGQAWRMSPQMVMILAGAGAGAGIAGIFKAPIGGMLFTIEVMRLPLTVSGVIALLVACLTSALTAYSLSGFTIDLAFASSATLNTTLIIDALILGIFCGFYSLYYSYIMKKVETWLDKMRHPLVRSLAAGAGLGVCLFLFPALYGEGYGIIDKIINGHGSQILSGALFGITDSAWGIAVVAAGILLVKCAATSATNTGGVAGDFAPTLFAGSVAGLLFATVANNLIGLSLPPGPMALMGMAGVMAGAIRAPLMAIFLVLEITASYTLVLPITLTAALSFGIVRFFTSEDFFERR